MTDVRKESRAWMELILPLYAMGLVTFYYRPQVLPPSLEEELAEGVFKWLVWGIVGALGGILALSMLMLAFVLLYSPIYLVGHTRRILDPQAWVDRREVRFYLGCFVVLCGLLTLGSLNPEAGLTSFTLLAGCGLFFWRILV